ncbi:hypothetical protein E8E13_010089 [Curvularia kusanoi]|uniref:Hcy-binding domain-containing protein n=1 Tax=Curvularia kusanoi TaxID=90978 RepID=A0A9P4TKV6_CURKU|nr:hypothetical protein E8E13_010089 [Curvularia kusanoi]
MKITFSALLPFLAAAHAQLFYNETSAPFNLVLTSDNSTINGTTLSACHTGAALESLCLSQGGGVSNPNPLPAVQFNFNTSTDPFTPNATLGTPGILTWTLKTSSFDVPSSVYFFYDPTTDAALPLLKPGQDDSQILAFDDQDRLNVQGYVDYTANPPNSTSVKAYYRCQAALRQKMATPLILDGGMSRELMRLNAPFRQPEWSALALIEAPHLVKQVHHDFIAAGADIITTNSYALVPFHIGEERFWKQGAELAALAGRLAREAADAETTAIGRKILVAGSLPPIFGSYEPQKFDESRVQEYLAVLVVALAPGAGCNKVYRKASLGCILPG